MAEIESVNGTVQRSTPRTLLLQGENLPANGFSVVIVSPKVGVNTYVPKPLELRAEVKNSSLPIHQVEYLEANSATGPYKIIGKHYGPEFVIFRAYGVADSGKYLKVRAVDSFGNTTESEPVKITRVEDTREPQISPMTFTGPVLSGKKIVEKHPFNLAVAVNDPESGIESAILRRNGLIIAAKFDEGSIAITEKGAIKNQDLVYTLEVKDKAGNSNILTETYTVVEDTAPSITALVATPAQVQEQGEFRINLVAQDEIAVEKIEAVWNGFSQVVPFKNLRRLRL